MADDLPVVYIAGPITKPDPIANTNQAVLIADELYSHGVCVPLIPHMNLVWHLIRPHPNAYWYEYDLHLLRRCDGLLRLPGVSVGAELEVKVAKGVGIPVFFWGSDWNRQRFLDWCRSWPG